MKILRLRVEREGRGTTRLFRAFPVRIGRDPTSECHMPLASVSRLHARLDLLGGHLVLSDMGSRLGTWVGGWTQRLRPNQAVDLAQHGGEFQLGEFDFRAELVDMEDDQRKVQTAVVQTVDLGAAEHAFPVAAPAPASFAPSRDAMPRVARKAVAVAEWCREQGPEFLRSRGEVEAVFEALDPRLIEHACGQPRRWNPLRYVVLWREFVRRYDELRRKRADARAASAARQVPSGSCDRGPFCRRGLLDVGDLEPA